MGYLFLLLTILSESAAVICMKLSNGFQHKMPAGIAMITYIFSFVFLTLALKHLSVGWANAIWAGASTIWMQVVFLLLIATGLVGLQASKPA